MSVDPRLTSLCSFLERKGLRAEELWQGTMSLTDCGTDAKRQTVFICTEDDQLRRNRLSLRFKMRLASRTAQEWEEYLTATRTVVALVHFKTTSHPDGVVTYLPTHFCLFFDALLPRLKLRLIENDPRIYLGTPASEMFASYSSVLPETSVRSMDLFDAAQDDGEYAAHRDKGMVPALRYAINAAFTYPHQGHNK